MAARHADGTQGGGFACAFDHRQTQRVRHTDQGDEHSHRNQPDQQCHHAVDHGLPLRTFGHRTGHGNTRTGGEHILHVGEYVVQRNTRAFGVNAHKHDMPVGLDSTVGEVAGVHEGDRGIVGGDAAIVHLPRFERQRLCTAGLSIAVFGAAVRIITGRTIGGIGLCFGRSSRERNALVQRNILACSGGILGHQYGIAINGHTGQIGAHHLAQRVDAIHAHDQHTHTLAVGILHGHHAGRRVDTALNALDFGCLAGLFASHIGASGNHVDAVARGQRLVHGLLGTGGTSGDGGDQRHADKQCGTGGGHAARVLLNVRMCHFGGRTGQCNQRAHAAHEHR